MTSPLILLIETSTERGMIALSLGEEIAVQKELPFGLQNAQHLLPSIDACFKEASLSPQQLDAIAVGIGPGSYTGIRVGVAAAQALAFARQIPWIGLGTLECFFPSQDGSYAVLIDAKIGGIYLFKGIKNGSQFAPLSASALIPLNEIASHLQDVERIVTPHSAVLKSKLPQINLPWEEQSPQATHMAQLAFEKYARKEFVPEEKVELLYLRKTQAELEKKSKEK